MRHLPTSLFLIALLAIPLAAGAQVYKWTDANGTVHYADAPPKQGDNYEKVDPDLDSGRAERTSDSNAATNSDEETSDNDTSARATASRPNEKQKDTPENRNKLCDRVSQNIDQLQSNGPVITRDENGAQQVMDEDARKQRLQQARQRKKQYCQ